MATAAQTGWNRSSAQSCATGASTGAGCCHKCDDLPVSWMKVIDNPVVYFTRTRQECTLVVSMEL